MDTNVVHGVRMLYGRCNTVLGGPARIGPKVTAVAPGGTQQFLSAAIWLKSGSKPRLDLPFHLPSGQPHQDSFESGFCLHAVYIAWPLVRVDLSSSVAIVGASVRARSLWLNMERLFLAPMLHCPISYRARA